MANVQDQRLPWGKVPNLTALAAATLAFVCADRFFFRMAIIPHVISHVVACIA